MKTYANISDLFDCSARRFKDNIALQQLDSESNYVTTTYKELALRKVKIALLLSKLGLSKGSHIALIGTNSPRWVSIVAAIFHLGCVLVPIDCKSSVNEISHILQASDAELMINEFPITLPEATTSPEIEEISFVELFDNCSKITNIEENAFLKTQSEREAPGPDSLALLIYTSGTTGVSKGVMLTHFNILSNLEGVTHRLPICSDDSVLSILPLSHMFEFTCGMLYPITSGSTITYLRSLKGSEILKNMNLAAVTIMVTVPRILHLLQSNIVSKMKKLPKWKQSVISFLSPLTSMSPWFAKKVYKEVHDRFGGAIEFMVTGGAPIHKDSLLFFNNMGFKIIQGYGLTETSPILTATSLKNNIMGTAGHPLPNLKLKIDSPDASGVGEIIVSGPNIMKGYYKDQASTQKVIDNGWFRTGDVGYFEPSGSLVICGRIKALIITGAGKNIYPEELEKVFSQSELIEEICVVSKTDGKGGEKPYAFIVPSADISEKPEVVNQEISKEITALSKKLSPFKHLAGWQIYESALPKTATQKVKRFILQNKLDSNKSGK